MARRTKADAQATRSSLLDAAEQLFEARGVSRTSLNDIALAAGTTRGAIYWHFKDKADLFNAMIERVTLPMEQTLTQTVHAGYVSLVELRAMLLDALRQIATNEQTRRVMLISTHKVEYTAELGAVQERQLSLHRAWLVRNSQALERAAEEAHRPLPIALKAAAVGLQVLVEGLVQHWLLDPTAFDLAETGQTTIDTFLAGLGLPAQANDNAGAQLRAAGKPE